MALQLISDYKDNLVYRHSFNELADQTFGIDYERLYQLSFWNDRYICYSFIDDGKVVANVSASVLDIIGWGRKIKAVQIGTVMTAEEYRGRGLATKLIRTILEKYQARCELFYLFANPTVYNFYPKFGFHASVKESRFWVDMDEKIRYPGEARKLDVTKADDIELLAKIIRNRTFISNIFDVDHTECILWWHCLNTLPGKIYYVESLNIIVMAETKGDTLYLYDVIGIKKPEFRAIFQKIAPPEVKKVNFYFTADFKDIDIICTPYEPEDYKLFIKSDTVQFTSEFFYPFTAHA